MSRTYRILCLSEALSPITHMRGVSGNESIVARESVVTPDGVRDIPVLSGNALRHRAIREPGARWLIDAYQIAGTMTRDQLTMLLNGGGGREVSGGRESTAMIVEMRRALPILSLLGCSLPDQIVPGRLDMGRGLLVCHEKVAGIRAMLPDGFDLPVALRPAETFVSGYQYTRNDSAAHNPDLLVKGQSVSESNMMIFSGQSVMPGAMFFHDLTLRHVGELELGAALWSLRLWQGFGGTVGGGASKGHGRLDTAIHVVGESLDQDALVGAYIDHAMANRDAAVKWLGDAFRFDADDKPKGKKGKAKAEATADA